MTTRRKPIFKSRTTATAVGIAAMAVAACSFYDAFERRGRERPFVIRWLGV